MNVLQVGNTDLVGRRFNGSNLQRQLCKKGIDSGMVVFEKKLKDDFTWQISKSKYKYSIHSLFSKLENILSIQSLLYPYAWKLLFDKHFQSADLVHYHLIYPRFISLLCLPILTQQKPSVWTIHDPWPISGHCVHPFDCKRFMTGCGSCPYLSLPFKMEKDHTALMWKFKKWSYRYSKLNIVVASKWMYKIVNKSPLLSHFPIHLIPFGIDLKIFKPRNKKQSKKQMGIPVNNLVLTFRADPTEFKGLNYIKKCLRKINIKQKITLLTFGSRSLLNEFKSKYQIIDLAWVNNDEVLLRAYNASDIFIMPSIAESFGMMAIESMACGIPVIGFEGTALADTLFAPKGGVVVPKGNISKLLSTIEYFAKHPNKRRELGHSARDLAKKHYDLSRYVKMHIKLYNEISL